MKQALRCQRICILALLSISVLAPIVLVTNRLSNITSSIEHREFVQEISTIKSNNFKLSAIEQEVVGLKEPAQILYKDEKPSSLGSGHRTGITKLVDSNVSGTNRDDRKEKREPINQNIASISPGRKGQFNQTAVKVDANGHSQRQPRRVAADEKVREMRDQVIRARAYLSFTPPNSNSHLVKELKLRIKDVERALGEATKDSDLPRSASQRMKSMEATLSKAGNVYPDCAAMATKLRSMAHNTEEQVRTQKNQAAYLIHLASRTTSKGLHCLSMRLTTDYFELQPEKRDLPKQHNFNDPRLYHYAVFSDNILACAVVVKSTVSASVEPEKVVMHVVTDALNFPAMKMWFLLNPPGKATIEIKKIDDFEWLASKYASTLKQHDTGTSRFTSVLNHLRFYLPEIFPYLKRIVLLDHDVVVQKDLRALWKLDMKGKVNGAVENCEGNLSFRQIDKLINFSEPSIGRNFDTKVCTWAFGMNVFDLQEWRQQNLTAVYHKYLELGEQQKLWKSGTLPLGWLVFYNQTKVLDRRWHVLGLGYGSGVGRLDIERAAVIHYDGNLKPWLEIGIGEYKSYWNRHVKYDHPYMQQCNIHE